MNRYRGNRPKKGLVFLRRYCREATIVLSAALVLLVALIFPSHSVGEAFLLSSLLFFAFPVILIRFLMKEPLDNFGFSRGKTRPGIAYTAALVLIFGIIDYLLIFSLGLKDRFSVVRGLTESFWIFLALETVVAIPLYFFYETFFRGFVQFGLEKKIGGYSIVLAALLQALLFARKSRLVIALAFFSSLSAGLIAERSRSIAYSFAFSWIISVSLDIMLLKAIQQGIK